MEIIFPEYAEDGDEKAKLLQWQFAVGDAVKEGDEILELLTDKATFTIPAPCSGTLSKINVEEGAEVEVGQVLGVIEGSQD